MTDRELLNMARDAAQDSYSPYSHFPVGAALECADGSVFTGCNVENAALGSTICAERTAICKAVSEGRRKFVRIAIYGEGENYCLPCGACRQVMTEFMDTEAPLLLVSAQKDGGHKILEKKLKDFMPYPFPRLCDK